MQMRALLAGSIINLLREDPSQVEQAMHIAQRFFTPGADQAPEFGLYLARSITAIPKLQFLAKKTRGFSAMTKALLGDSEMLSALTVKPSNN